MKKILFTVVISSLFLTNSAQTASVKSADDQSDFDKKFRLGLRIAPQPCWLSSGDKNTTPNGARFGFGFGLNLEYKFSKVVSLLFGAGADFEGGSVSFTNDPANNYQVGYILDNGGNLISPPTSLSTLPPQGSKGYNVISRTYKSTYVSVPVLLKLSTNEYSGFKYFGQMGLELAYRVKVMANDTYKPTTSNTMASQNDINFNKDAAFPIRLGFNAGIGSEYRIAGSTSLFVSFNYFLSFTNLMQGTSQYQFTGGNISSSGFQYNYLNQSLTQNALRINIGVMF
ncbi:MAG: hypothetical protein JSU07_03315 [Bacteroidetes bacterium]|nr:hypothetical protein [Bacteroidota bacterium]